MIKLGSTRHRATRARLTFLLGREQGAAHVADIYDPAQVPVVADHPFAGMVAPLSDSSGAPRGSHGARGRFRRSGGGGGGGSRRFGGGRR